MATATASPERPKRNRAMARTLKGRKQISNSTTQSEHSSELCDHADETLERRPVPQHVVGKSQSRFVESLRRSREHAVGNTGNFLLTTGEWEPLPSRTKAPLTTGAIVTPESGQRKKGKSSTRGNVASKRLELSKTKNSREKVGRPTTKERPVNRVKEEFEGPILSRDELERIRLGAGRTRMKPNVRLIDLLEPTFMFSGESSVVGMVVKTKTRKKAPEPTKTRKIKSSGDPPHVHRSSHHRRRKTHSSPTGEEVLPRKKESKPTKVVEEEIITAPLTKELLKANARAVSKQIKLQDAVAAAILSRYQNHIVESPMPSRGSTQWQSCYRGYFVRRMNKKEIDILRISDGVMHQVWTGYFKDIGFHLDLIDIITIQSFFRQRRLRAEFLEQRNAAILLQSLARRWIAEDNVYALCQRRSRELEEDRAAVRIQAVARACIAVRQVEVLKQIQVFVLAERRARQKDAAAAVVIQASWRGYCGRADFAGAVLSAILIQTTARQWLARRDVSLLKRQQMRQIEKEKQRAALAEKKALQREERAATLIQSGWRSYSCHAYYLDVMLATVMIQSVIRKFLARRDYGNKIECAKKIQALSRGVSGRKQADAVKQRNSVAQQSAAEPEDLTGTTFGVDAEKQRNSVVQPSPTESEDLTGKGFTVQPQQSTTNVVVVPCLETGRNCSSSLIQGAARRTKGRVEAKKKNKCATTIQSVVRGFFALRKYKIIIGGVCRLQALCRARVTRDVFREFYQRQRAAIMIQRHARGFLTRFNLLIHHYAAFEIQEAWRDSKDREMYREAQYAASTIQRAWKHSVERRQLSPEVRATRTAIQVQPQSQQVMTTKSVDKDNSLHEEVLSDLSLSTASLSVDDKPKSREEMHNLLLAFESKRRSTYDPVLKDSMMKWRSSVDALQASVEEMVHAERLIFGSAVANQVLGEAMFDASDDSNSFTSEGGSLSTGGTSLKRKKKAETAQHSPGNAYAYMDVSDEMTRVREDLQAQVNALSEMGGIIIGELESAEMGVIEAWDSFDAVSMAASDSCHSPGSSVKSSSSLSERGTDLWLQEMHYCVAVAFQVLSWQRAVSDLSNIFGTVSTTERKHRSRLRELLLVFASQRRQQESSFQSMQAEDLQELVDNQVDQIHPQIEDLIRETESRPFVDVPSNFLEIEASDFTTLASPMESVLLCGAEIMEMGAKGGFGRRTNWDKILAIRTEDSFVHFFDMAVSSVDVTEPTDVFHELIMLSQFQKLDGGEKTLHDCLRPVESFFLPNCTAKVIKKEKRNFELKEEFDGKKGKGRTTKQLLRTGSPSETAEWIRSLGIQLDK